jgi:hypothetical protein
MNLCFSIFQLAKIGFGQNSVNLLSHNQDPYIISKKDQAEQPNMIFVHISMQIGETKYLKLKL